MLPDRTLSRQGVGAFLHGRQNVLFRVHHGKNTRMNFTRTTSARMTKSEDRTTELVAENPTPAVPPWVRIPWKHPIIPMIRPKTAVLRVGATKSLKLAPRKPLLMNLRKETGSTKVSAIQPNTTAQKSAARVKSGSIRMQAAMRVKAKNLKGFTPEASMASICSVTFIDPNSAPIPAPTLPLTTRPVTIGPVSRRIEYTRAAGSMDLAPNRTRLLRLSRERTAPMAAPANATSGNDLEPISSSCRISSRPSKGRRTAARITCHAKRPRSPNHSRRRLIRLQTEVRVDDMGNRAWPAAGLIQRCRILASWLIILA